MIRLITITFFLYSCVAYANAAQYPTGFSDFFSFKDKQVEIKGINDDTHLLMLNVNYNVIRLTNNLAEHQQIIDFLYSKNVNEDAVNSIMADLALGIESSSRCTERLLKDCVLLPEKYEFIYNYNSNILYFFINPELLTFSHSYDNLRYAKSKDTGPSLINHLNMGGDKYNDQDFSYYIQDEFILGLPYGYINSDMQFQEDQKKQRFDLYKASYNLDLEGYHLRAGIFRIHESFNATDLLLTNGKTVNAREASIAFGTSSNLLLDKKNKEKVIYYYAPAAGRLVVSSGERLLLERNTSEGQGVISYEELPYGKFELLIEVKSGNKVLYSSSHSIYNNRSDILATGAYDYLISAGQLSDVSYDDIDPLNQEDANFFKGLIAYRLFDETLLGFGLTTSDIGHMGQIAVSTYLPLSGKASLNYSGFSNGATYLDASYSFRSITFSYENYKMALEDAPSLANTYFGQANFTRAYVGAAYPISPSIFSVFNLMYSKEESNILDKFNLHSVTANLTVSAYSIANSKFDLSVGYTNQFDQDYIDDEIALALNMSVPLTTSGNVSFSSLVSGNENGVSLLRNSLTVNEIASTANMRSSATIASNYARSPNLDNAITTDATWLTDFNYSQASGGLFANYNSSGYNGVSGNISNSQVINKEGIFLTSQRADSYALVSVKTNEQADDNTHEDNNNYGFLTISERGKVNDSQFLYQENNLIPLQRYNYYDLDINTELSQLHNSGQKQQAGFVQPGSVLSLQASVGKTSMFIAGFSDIFNKRLLDVECIGEGCVSVTPISKGVYNFVVRDKLPFEIHSSNNICNISNFSKAKKNYGLRYCLPDIAVGEQQSMVENDEIVLIHFIGRFESNQITDVFVRQLSDAGIDVHSKLMNEELYVYITYPDYFVFSTTQQLVLDDLLSLAIKDNKKIKNEPLILVLE